ncbi:MAG: hypothetical protein HGA49_03825 [Eubacteriaceae bacterium]|nr:hypothetical protein [Eubacteriaceae bacterium]
MKSYEQYVSKTDVERIHENTLRILSEVGVRFESEKAIEVFKNHGVKVEGDTVYIDEDTLKKCLATAPSTFEMVVNHDGTRQTLGAGAMLTCVIGHPAYIAKEGRIEQITSQDSIDQFKMSESSAVANSSNLNFAFLNGLHPTEEQQALGQIAFLLKYSNKYKIHSDPFVIGFSADKSYEYSKKGIDLMKNFFGLQDKHVMLTIINPLSPLCFDAGPINKMLAYTEENQVCAISPCGMPLLTSPASLAGMMSETNAEVLAGLVFIQLVKPGTPVIYGTTSGATDMRTIQLGIGTPEASLVSYATAALADFYQLPFRTGGALSDAKDLDVQAGAESMLMMHTTYNVKPDFVLHHIGCMGTFNVVSLEKFIVDEEIAMMVQRQLKGIDTSDERLCFNEISKVGPRGSFLQGRTPSMYRKEFCMAKVFNKDDPNNWQNTGSKSVFQNAREEVQRRISSYTPPELTKEQINLVKPYLPDVFKETI